MSARAKAQRLAADLYSVSTLHERNCTQVDLFLPGQDGHVAIECKFWEQRLAPCSQVAARRCNGHYAPQPGRAPGQRCALTEKKVAYWTYIPQLFRWRADEDHVPCPIREPYQLVRNVLAAAIEPATRQVWGQPAAVLIYDARNPAFHPGGRVDGQFQAVRSALQGPAVFRRTTWQALAQVLAKQGRYEDLLAWLQEKYGIAPGDPSRESDGMQHEPASAGGRNPSCYVWTPNRNKYARHRWAWLAAASCC